MFDFIYFSLWLHPILTLISPYFDLDFALSLPYLILPFTRVWFCPLVFEFTLFPPYFALWFHPILPLSVWFHLFCPLISPYFDLLISPYFDLWFRPILPSSYRVWFCPILPFSRVWFPLFCPLISPYTYPCLISPYFGLKCLILPLNFPILPFDFTLFCSLLTRVWFCLLPVFDFTYFALWFRPILPSTYPCWISPYFALYPCLILPLRVWVCPVFPFTLKC